MTDELVLPVERKVWYFTLRRNRLGQRGRPEAETAVRWARRWHQRSRDTVTGSLSLDASDAHADFFIRNLSQLRVTVPRIVGGQDYGLPANFYVHADLLAIPSHKP